MGDDVEGPSPRRGPAAPVRARRVRRRAAHRSRHLPSRRPGPVDPRAQPAAAGEHQHGDGGVRAAREPQGHRGASAVRVLRLVPRSPSPGKMNRAPGPEGEARRHGGGPGQRPARGDADARRSPPGAARTRRAQRRALLPVEKLSRMLATESRRFRLESVSYAGAKGVKRLRNAESRSARWTRDVGSGRRSSW